jgi:hypothetical protein
VFTNLSLRTGTSFNFPMRRVIESGSRLGIRGRGKDDLVFGNIYTGNYFKPVGKTGVEEEELNFLPLHDFRPLFIFAGWYPSTTKGRKKPKTDYEKKRKPAGPTMLGFNLHFTIPGAYEDDTPRDQGGQDDLVYVPYGDDDFNPTGTREIAIAVINVIKQKLGVALGEDMRDNIFQEQGVDIDEIEGKYLQMTADEARILQKIISESAMSKQGINWGAITSINNRYLRMLKVIMRRYSIKRMPVYSDIDSLDVEDRMGLLQGPGFIRIAGGGKWNDSDINAMLRQAMNNNKIEPDQNRLLKVIRQRRNKFRNR